MSKVTIIRCDRCGREIEEKHTFRFMPQVVDLNGNLEPQQPYEDEMERDYCEECKQAIIDFMHSSPHIPAAVQVQDVPKVDSVPEKESTPAEDVPKEDVPEESTPEETAVLESVLAGDKPKTGGKFKRRTLDAGKVKALRNAGWSIGKIANEMGFSQQAIYNCLSRLEKAKQQEG